MKKLIFALAVVSIVMACNKDQKAVRILDGKWQLEKQEYTENGITITVEANSSQSETLEFSKCKLKKDEFCDVKITTLEDNEITVSDYSYKVEDEGRELVLQGNFDGLLISQSFEIEELTKKELVLEITYQDGSSNSATYEKR